MCSGIATISLEKVSDFNAAHSNYLAPDSARGPLAVSVINDGTTYKALVRSNLGCDRLSVPVGKVKANGVRKVLKMAPPLGSIVSAMGYILPTEQCVLSKDSNLPNELLAMEERQVIRSYKFGIEYCGPNQRTEAQALSNTAGFARIT
jgi:RAP1 GTPase activating protein 1